MLPKSVDQSGAIPAEARRVAEVGSVFAEHALELTEVSAISMDVAAPRHMRSACLVAQWIRHRPTELVSRDESYRHPKGGIGEWARWRLVAERSRVDTRWKYDVPARRRTRSSARRNLDEDSAESARGAKATNAQLES